MDIDKLILKALEERVQDARPPANARQRVLARAGQPPVQRALGRLRRQRPRRRRPVPQPWLMPHYFHESYPRRCHHPHSISVVISQSTCQLLVLML